MSKIQCTYIVVLNRILIRPVGWKLYNESSTSYRHTKSPNHTKSKHAAGTPVQQPDDNMDKHIQLTVTQLINDYYLLSSLPRKKLNFVDLQTYRCYAHPPTS